MRLPGMLTYTITGTRQSGAVPNLADSRSHTGILSLPLQSGATRVASLTIVASDGSYSVQTTLDFDDSNSVPPGQLADPDFSAVSVGAGNWQYAPSGSPWTFSGTAGVSGNGSDITAGNPSCAAREPGGVRASHRLDQPDGEPLGRHLYDRVLGGPARELQPRRPDACRCWSTARPSAAASRRPARTMRATQRSAFTVTAGTHTITIAGTNPAGRRQHGARRQRFAAIGDSQSARRSGL